MKKEAHGEQFIEAELKDLLLQVAMGLKYIHSSGLVHLDIKPSTCPWPLFFMLILCSVYTQVNKCVFQLFLGNIFICQQPSTSAGGEGDSEEEDDESTLAGVIYKIGI